MNINIIAVTQDKGKLKDGTPWVGTRLVIQEDDEDNARTYIAKAAKDFPIEEVSSAVTESGRLAVSRLLYDRFVRVVGYELY